MQAVVYKPGGVENLSVETVSKPLIKDQHVLIKVHYFAINRADTLQRKGLYPPPKGESGILGLEAAGVVEEFGMKCSKKWRLDIKKEYSRNLTACGSVEYRRTGISWGCNFRNC